MISKYDIISTLLEAIRQLNIRITNAYWLRSSSIDEMYGDFFYSLCKKNLKILLYAVKSFVRAASFSSPVYYLTSSLKNKPQSYSASRLI